MSLKRGRKTGSWKKRLSKKNRIFYEMLWPTPKTLKEFRQIQDRYVWALLGGEITWTDTHFRWFERNAQS